MKARKEIHYLSYGQDFVVNGSQDKPLPPDYRWIRPGRCSAALYRLGWWVYLCVSFIYLRVIKGVRTVGRREVLRRIPRGQGAFIYGNHTMAVGDPLQPGIFAPGRRSWAVGSPANFGTPVIGPFLHYFGFIPLPDSPSRMRPFCEALSKRCAEGGLITIYPEAHLWPYCTFLRPWPDAAVHYPVSFNAPAVTAVTTYSKPRRGRKPRITVYYRGPFTPDTSLPQAERKHALAQELRQAMAADIVHSTYQYYKYIKDETE